MDLNFQLTPADFREALAAHATPSQPANTGKPAKRGISTLGWLVILAFFVILFVIFRDTKPTPSGPASAPRAEPFTNGLTFQAIAWIGLILTVLAMRLRISFDTTALNRMTTGERIPTSTTVETFTPRIKPPPKAAFGLPSFCLIFFGIVLIIVKTTVSPGVLLTPVATIMGQDTARFLLEVVSWVLILASFWTAFHLQSRALKKQIAAEAPLPETRSLTVTPEGITIHEPNVQHLYAWLAFLNLRQTDNLLLLYTSPTTFHIIPKRAFPNPADLEAFLALLQSQLPANTHAFPVLLSPPSPSASSVT